VFFTSASPPLKSGIYLSPVSDRLDKTPNGWLTEWVHSVRIRRETLTAFADSIRWRIYSMSGCQSFPCTYVWLYMWLFHNVSRMCKSCNLCQCTVCPCYVAHVPTLVWCIAVWNGYWQHDVMCIICLYPCVSQVHIWNF